MPDAVVDLAAELSPVDVDAAGNAAAACVRHVFPEWAELPVYVLPLSRVPAGLRIGINGMTSPVMDLVVREAVEHWYGRGPCLIWNDRPGWVQDYAELKRWATSVVLHEAVHVALWDHPFYATADTPEPMLAMLGRASVTRVEVMTDAEVEDRQAEHHGWRYVRAAVVACRRAAAANYPVDPGTVLDLGYPLFPLHRYERALSSDLFGLSTVTGLNRVPPSSEFLGLWLSARGLRLSPELADAVVAAAGQK